MKQKQTFAAVQSRQKTSYQTNDRLIAIEEVCKLTSLSRATIYRKLNKGVFPKKYPISAKRIAFKFNEIQAWINNVNNSNDLTESIKNEIK